MVRVAARSKFPEIKLKVPSINEMAQKISKNDHMFSVPEGLRDLMCLKYSSVLGSGRHRFVCKGKGNFVIKVPYNIPGMEANISEYKVYTKEVLKEGFYSHPEMVYAKCRLHYVNKIPLLFMEYIDVNAWAGKPGWAERVDCGQVGQDRKGVWKAYDYSVF